MLWPGFDAVPPLAAGLSVVHPIWRTLRSSSRPGSVSRPTWSRKTTVTETTVILIASDGEWTRRRVPSPQHARAWANKIGIPVYDVALIGYPKRMREYNRRHRSAT